VRRPSFLIATASSALVLAACGSEGVSVPEDDANAAGAEIFATHCGGCHTISAAGTQGSGNRALRSQGPNFNERVESYDDALFAIQNGGFSGAIMPQNIVVGDDAEAVAQFLADYSGSEVDDPPQPSSDGSSTDESATADEGGGSGGESGSGGGAGGSAG